MSSVTSTSATDQVGADVPRPRASGARVQPDHTFRASHFFVLASLMAATAAVVVSRQSTPEHLVLVSLTIGAAGLAAAGFYRMLSPLVGDGTDRSSEPLSIRARQVLEREKMLAMRAIKDLEFDRSMGKLSQADFDEMAGRLRARAMSLIQQLDEDGSGYRSLIEREIRDRVAASPSGVATPITPAAPAEAGPAVEGACACGTINDADAVFCKRCGARLAPAAAADSDK
jgi:hypothetical protein